MFEKDNSSTIILREKSKKNGQKKVFFLWLY